MSACSDYPFEQGFSENIVKFSATNETRVTGSTWDDGDRIAVTMSGSNLSKTSVAYSIDSSGEMSPVYPDQVLRYPTEDFAVDFFAVFPFSAVSRDNKVLLDVTKGGGDILYSRTMQHRSEDIVNLKFSHLLCEIKLVFSDSRLNEINDWYIQTAETAVYDIISDKIVDYGNNKKFRPSECKFYVIPGAETSINIVSNGKVRKQKINARRGSSLIVNINYNLITK